MSSNEKSVDEISNWNLGFFKNQESMGEFERNVLNDPPIRDSSDGDEDYEWNENKNTRHDKLHDIDDNLENNEEETGWNLGFFAGQEVMSDEERRFWTQDVRVNNEDLIDNDLLADLDNSDYDKATKKQDDDYKKARERLNEGTYALRNSMIFADESIDDIRNNKRNKDFVDHDNYDKFLPMKTKGDWLNIYIEIILISLYTFVFLGLLLFEMLIYFGYVQSVRRPNWGMMLIPIILITILKSLNSYSMIKISF